ncbi:MAG: phenylalanine--tRNA ligase subunit alpha [Thermoplasmata archaeon]
MEDLSPLEKKLLVLIRERITENAEKLVDGNTFLTITEVMNAASWLKMKGLVEISEKVVRFATLGEEGLRYLNEGLPERKLWEFCKTRNGKLQISEGKEVFGTEFNIALMHLKNAGAIVEKGILQVPPENTEKIENEIKKREKFLKNLTEPKDENTLDKSMLSYFMKRKNLIELRERTIRTIKITDKGMEIANKVHTIEEEVSQLTTEIIQSGRWKNLKLRKYDITRFTPPVYGGREHPLTQLTSAVRKIFLSMGFTEIDYGILQNAFWNMDALFVPQDHPARDMQDTFYLENPEKIPVSNEEWIEKVRAVHENGGETGSEGWGYRWSMEEAEKALLRTHSTVNTIRYLAEHPDKEVKVFSIARVFRNENIDATHLPEFMQIEGIVVEENASLAMLIGILREFYKRVGFYKVKFHPAYFPFTEPSLEVYTEVDGKILELGGAGIFRPEVVRPFGVRRNVLAWGLGLERLAMIKYQFETLPDIYSNKLEILRKPYSAKLWR